MQVPDAKTKKPFVRDWRVLCLILGFIAVLFVAVPLLPMELRVVALLIPLSVFATAAFTYWMVTPSTKSQVVLGKAKMKASRLAVLSKVSPTTVQELFDDLPIALLRISKDGRIKQTN